MVAEYNRENERARLKELLEAAQDELVEAFKQRETLDHRISVLQKDVTHLAGLCDEEVEDPVKQMGLTDAVRYVLGQRKEGAGLKLMTPIEIRDAIAAGGYDVSEYSNIMASIHTILRRLRKKGEVMSSAMKGGSYVWTGKGMTPPPPIPGWLRERLK